MNTSPPRNNKTKLWIAVGLTIVVGLGVLFAVRMAGNTSNNVTQPQTNESKTSEDKSNDSKTAEEIARSVTPCELLNDSERAGFQLGAGAADNRNIRSCQWKAPDNLYVSVAIYPLYSLDRMPVVKGITPQLLTIGSRPAQQSVFQGVSPARICQIDVAFGPGESATARIGAHITGDETSPKSCDVAKEIAEIVAAKLPS